ncbi:hypothetical protein [Streptomyces sp. NPDC014894]|uniref:hypothetical protein n=1 Tax=Streptomyces sp. NPDC014894 TaxID=3364931 RepID=UPI0036FE7088
MTVPTVITRLATIPELDEVAAPCAAAFADEAVTAWASPIPSPGRRARAACSARPSARGR